LILPEQFGIERLRETVVARGANLAAFSDFFSHAAHWTARQTGRASTFGLALFVVIAWAASGPIFHFSDTWQLVINTGTTIVTFLMVFLLQHAQNRDSIAIQLKLDELIRVNQDARNKLLTLEDLTEVELDQVKAAFASLAAKGEASPELDEVCEDISRAQETLEDVKQKIDDAAAE
jgi:low affinity Fe/Cu permease